MKRKILFVAAGCVVLAVLYGLKEYYRTPEDISGKQAVAEMTVPELTGAFEKDSAQSHQRYVDQVIAVKGRVTGVQADGHPVVLTLGEEGQMSSVQCSMDSAYSVSGTLVVGKNVKVKGLCTGAIVQDFFGTDVKLSRCVIVEP